MGKGKNEVERRKENEGWKFERVGVGNKARTILYFYNSSKLGKLLAFNFFFLKRYFVNIKIYLCGCCFSSAFPLDNETHFLFIWWKFDFFEKRLGVATYFYFIFEGKNKIRKKKKNPKYDS